MLPVSMTPALAHQYVQLFMHALMDSLDRYHVVKWTPMCACIQQLLVIV